jgi:uncharacterized spore protein YtfJ
MSGISVDISTNLAPETIIGETRLLVESQAVVLRLPGSAFVWNRPLAVTVVRNGAGQRVQIHRQRTKGVHTMMETMDGSASSPAAASAGPQTNEFFDKILAAAQPSAVFSAPVVAGAYTVITASEVFAGGGFGFGRGDGPARQHHTESNVMEPGPASGSGGGGGGGSHSRPVAAIIIGPKDVKVRPIVDATRIALAAMAAWGAMAFMATRIARARASANHHHRHH